MEWPQRQPLQCCLASCQSKKADDASSKDGDPNAKVTLTIFDKNAQGLKWNDPIAKEVEKETGVKVKIQSPSGDANTKLGLMLASHDYPDIVLIERASDLMNKYIEAKALIPLNELVSKYGKDAQKMYAPIWNKIRYKDGKNYYLSNWYGKTTQPSQAFNVRYDYMIKLVGKERADSSQPFTQEEFTDLLRKFKKEYPTINGKKSIPLTIGSGGDGTGGMFGVKNYYQTGNKVQLMVQDPKFRKNMLWLNQLSREGLLDPEWVSNNDTLRDQKLSQGNIFCTASSYWLPETVNAVNAKTIGKDAQYVAYKVLGDGIGPKETTYNPRSALGWEGVGITDNCKNPAAAMKFLNFIASRKGQSLLLWGRKDKDYTVKSDGAYVPVKTIADEFKNDPKNAGKNTGIAKWTWCVNNAGPNDKTPMRVYDYITRQEFWDKFAYKNMTDTLYDTSPWEGIEPAANSPEALKAGKIDQVTKQAVPKIINATSEAQANQAFDKMQKDAQAAGEKDVEKVLSENYVAQQKLWNKK